VTKYGVKAEGNAQEASAAVLAHLAQRIDQGELEIPIARVYPLAAVREAYRELEQRHTMARLYLCPERSTASREDLSVWRLYSFQEVDLHTLKNTRRSAKNTDADQTRAITFSFSFEFFASFGDIGRSPW
jgi:hypothetical protein